MMPGGSEIALATSKLMNEFQSVVWSQHGIFCAGNTLDDAFGLLHTIEKAAEIYNKQCLICSTRGFSKLGANLKGEEFPNSISDKNLLAIAEKFKVKIRKDFLYLD